MPDLDRFYREAADKAAILAIAPARHESGMRRLVMEGKYSFPILLDQGVASEAYNIRYVPTVFVIDAGGRLVDQFVGASDFAKLSQIADGFVGG
jgi:hypothetical protein